MAQRRFVIGDIHGAYKAMLQCFERSGFDTQNDLLISLGDLCDGWPDVNQVFDELLGIKNLILLMGNHDNWLLRWFETGDAPDIWLMQGGDITVNAIKTKIPAQYINLLRNARLYYELDNKLFVHGGFIPDLPIGIQDKQILLWDRSLVNYALFNTPLGRENRISSYEMVFVGHTPTINYMEGKPIIANGVCLMDTGAGWPGGMLSIMDIDTGGIYQSDVVSDLYAEAKGR